MEVLAANTAKLLTPNLPQAPESGGFPMGEASSHRWTWTQEPSSDGSDLDVNTLSASWMPGIGSGRLLEGPQCESSVLAMDRENYQAEGTVKCHRLSQVFVFCMGKVKKKTAELPVAVAKLPSRMCPPRPLCFVAFAREADSGKSNLAMLLVRQDGLIVQVGGPSSSIVIDISGVRFSQDRGISLVDEVSLHVLDIMGTRIVNMQGHLRQKVWRQCHKITLAKLPMSCKPLGDISFITPGDGPGNFNLTGVNANRGTGDHGGELKWADSHWRRDKLHMSGVTFEVDPSAMSIVHHVRTGEVMEVLNHNKMRDFRNRIVSVYGSLERGVAIAFALKSDDREIGFAEFSAGCKLLGCSYEVTRLWEILDEDRSGGISKAEMFGHMEGGDSPQHAIQNHNCSDLLGTPRTNVPTDNASMSTGSSSTGDDQP